jgi:hypothetical protein
MHDLKQGRGYITIAQRSGKFNYLRMAYALALSLKATQSTVSALTVLVTPGTKIPKKYAAVFDKVIEMPWRDDAANSKWKIHNKWKAYHLSPYEETVLVDSDMIFPTDISHWWDTMDEKEVWFTTMPMTYRGEPIGSDAYRQPFIINSLPMVYTAFTYFRRTPITHMLFELVKDIYHGWDRLYTHYGHRPTDDDVLTNMMSPTSAKFSSHLRWNWSHFIQDFPIDVSGDLAFAIAVKIMGVEDRFTSNKAFPTFVHMKPMVQGLSITDGDWSSIILHTLRDDGSLLVGNYRQQYPFHYVEKDWLTDNIVAKLEKAARG